MYNCLRNIQPLISADMKRRITLDSGRLADFFLDFAVSYRMPKGICIKIRFQDYHDGKYLTISGEALFRWRLQPCCYWDGLYCPILYSGPLLFQRIIVFPIIITSLWDTIRKPKDVILRHHIKNSVRNIQRYYSKNFIYT